MGCVCQWRVVMRLPSHWQWVRQKPGDTQPGAYCGLVGLARL